MKPLYLSRKNVMGENIEAIIEFVKQVEREDGLTDELIECKYTRCFCLDLAENMVHQTLLRLFDKEDLKTVNVFKAPSDVIHYYVEWTDDNGTVFYYDILGKKTEKEMRLFMEDEFWCKETSAQELELKNKKKFGVGLAKAACFDYIEVEPNVCGV